MKKIPVLLILAAFMLSPMAARPAHAEEAYQENVLDKMSDWAATVGKDKEERDAIVARRKAERQMKHAEKKAAQMKKKAEKKASEAKKEAAAAGKDMKKKLGM